MFSAKLLLYTRLFKMIKNKIVSMNENEEHLVSVLDTYHENIVYSMKIKNYYTCYDNVSV